MSGNFSMKTKSFAATGAQSIRNVGRKLADSAGSSKVIRSVTEVSGKTKSVVENSAVGKAAGRLSKNVGEQLDSVTGAKILALVEERLQIQSRYNDLLATKLEEALHRIAALELLIQEAK